MKFRMYAGVLALLSILAASCNNNPQPKTEETPTPPAPVVKTPVFNEDSAYQWVSKTAGFGPRVPGTPAQKNCALWMAAQLSVFCDTVYTQYVTVTGGDNKPLPCYNMVGAIHPTAPHRILLLTHWDSRPWADEDIHDKETPIIAADDGGSGVGVLLEVARAVKTMPLPAEWGIDILLEDVEDYGRSQWGEQSWCLGTQYWARHPHVAGYRAEFGILLDMVGAHGATFPMEGLSGQLAPEVQQFVWQAASRAGYSSYFPFQPGAGVTDDHLPVNKIAGIKTVDIINLTTNGTSTFAPHWHTHNDNMQVIDKATLKAVGQTLLQVIYESGASSAQP